MLVYRRERTRIKANIQMGGYAASHTMRGGTPQNATAAAKEWAWKRSKRRGEEGDPLPSSPLNPSPQPSALFLLSSPPPTLSLEGKMEGREGGNSGGLPRHH